MAGLRRALGLAPWNAFAPYLLGALGVGGGAIVALAAMLGAGLAPPFSRTVGLALLAIALVCVAIFLRAARREARRIVELLSGEVWARWHYDAANAARLAAAEWERSETLVRQSAGSAFLSGTLVVGALAVSGLNLLRSVAVAGGLAALLLLVAETIYLRGRARYRRSVEQHRELLFGPGAFLRDGNLFSLHGRAVRLTSIEVVLSGDVAGEATPNRLRVVRQVRRSAAPMDDWGLLPRRSWANSEIEIAIPAGREEEARALIERYRRAHALEARHRSPAAGPNERASGLAARPS